MEIDSNELNLIINSLLYSRNMFSCVKSKYTNSAVFEIDKLLEKIRSELNV